MTSDGEEQLSLKEKIQIAKEKLMSRRGIITLSTTIGLLLLILLLMKACEPRKGSIFYGICGAFLEQQIVYPETIEHQYVEQYSAAIRIYYSHIDGFGQSLNEYIECSFEKPPQKGLQLKGVIFNTIKLITKKQTIKNKGRIYEVEQEYIDKFNKSNSIGVIISADPDLTLPQRNILAF